MNNTKQNNVTTEKREQITGGRMGMSGLISGMDTKTIIQMNNGSDEKAANEVVGIIDHVLGGDKIQKYRNTGGLSRGIDEICIIRKVSNIQQEEDVVTGDKKDKYSTDREMFCVETKDKRFQRLYQYDETDNILSDLLQAGYITYSEFYRIIDIPCGTRIVQVSGGQLLEEELHQKLMEISKRDYEGVCYNREELSKYKNTLCVVHGNRMHWNGKDMPAFRYRCGKKSRSITSCGSTISKVTDFCNDIKGFIENQPMVQLIMAYYLSGAIRQILASASEGVGEYGLVACITGEPASGKTTVTTTMMNILFGKGKNVVSNNITSIGLYNIIRDSGICPVVRDDSSTDTNNSLSVIKQKVLDIYNIASGKCRITDHSECDMPLYAPFIESREGNWGLADMLKPIRQVEGYRFRVLEIYCHQGDLTENAQAARDFGALNDKYAGMAVAFLDYLVDTYSETDIQKMYKEYIEILEEKLRENSLEDRYANRTAVIMTSARVCSEAYGLEFDMDAIISVMISSIKSFESRLVATPDNHELKNLYRFFTDRDRDGNGVNDRFISSSTSSYRHKKHYAAFTKKEDIFVVPQALLEFITEGEFYLLVTPGENGYDGINCKRLDWGTPTGERWKAIEENWVEQGILIGRKGEKTPTHTVKLNGKNTSCYKFSWKRIQQLLGDNKPLDMTRFDHDSEEQAAKKSVGYDF